jgi:hypothetical protein
MVDVAWLIFLVSLVLSADFAWASFRDWRIRRIVAKTGSTLTRRFLFPPT